MKILKVTLAVICLALGSGAALAQHWPSRPITMIVPYNPGGTTDNLARLAADAISTAVKQPVVVENKPGAAGVVGATLASKAPNDGYTIFFGNNATNVVQPLINSAVRYDPIKNFDGIATTADAATFVGVNSGLGIKDLKSFVAYLKKHPNTKYGTAGVGSMGQFTAEYFLMTTGTHATHIPYPGSNNAAAAVMSGEVQFMIDPVVLRYAGSNKITILAALTAKRHPNLPNVPTAKELGYNVEVSGWFGLFAPKGTDPKKIEVMSAAVKKLVQTPSYRKQVLRMGLLPDYRDPAETNAVVKKDLAVFKKIRDEAGIKIR